MNLHTVPLKSAGIARVLLWLIRLHLLALIGLSTILTLIAIAIGIVSGKPCDRTANLPS